MKYLCDTQHFIWTVEDSAKLSQRATAILADSSQQIYLSIASIWEMTIKVSLGKLKLAKPLIEVVKEEFASNRFLPLEISLTHFKVLETLPFYHKDPFDRLLVAQALADGLPIISSDAHFDAYGVQRIW